MIPIKAVALVSKIRPNKIPTIHNLFWVINSFIAKRSKKVVTTWAKNHPVGQKETPINEDANVKAKERNKESVLL